MVLKEIEKTVYIHTYDFKKILPMLEEIQKIFKTKDLSTLEEKIEVVIRENDQKTSFHKTFYDNFEGKFLEEYRDFVSKVVKPLISPDEPLVYQVKPSFRIHLQNNKSVGEYHKDSDYGHPIEEINIFLPFTKCWETNTIWIENDNGEKQNYDLNLGQFLIFRGGLLKHGNKENKEGKTRVSIDFRVIPLSKFKPTEYSSVNTGKKIEIGDYYEVMK